MAWTVWIKSGYETNTNNLYPRHKCSVCALGWWHTGSGGEEDGWIREKSLKWGRGRWEMKVKKEGKRVWEEAAHIWKQSKQWSLTCTCFQLRKNSMSLNFAHMTARVNPDKNEETLLHSPYSKHGDSSSSSDGRRYAAMQSHCGSQRQKKTQWVVKFPPVIIYDVILNHIQPESPIHRHSETMWQRLFIGIQILKTGAKTFCQEQGSHTYSKISLALISNSSHNFLCTHSRRLNIFSCVL